MNFWSSLPLRHSSSWSLVFHHNPPGRPILTRPVASIQVWETEPRRCFALVTLTTSGSSTNGNVLVALGKTLRRFWWEGSFSTARMLMGFTSTARPPATRGNPHRAVTLLTSSTTSMTEWSQRVMVGQINGWTCGMELDSSNSYHFTDNSAATGTKCIAGYCYLNKPIWFMVRWVTDLERTFWYWGGCRTSIPLSFCQ